MAGWITHMRIADEVMKRLPGLDRLCFCMGSIAPDCNVENEDWTAFTPPREVTHWMSGKGNTKPLKTVIVFLLNAFAAKRLRMNRSVPFIWAITRI